MYIKLFGAVCILAGCGGFGIRMAAMHRREVSAMHQIVNVIDGMLCELEYSMIPLPELCRKASEFASGAVHSFFSSLAAVLDEQLSPDVWLRTESALKATRGVPPQAAEELRVLGRTLGRFDLQGQLTALRQCRQACINRIEQKEYRQSERLRSYQTLGFCAGAGLAILLF
jgi:stage III sporulation protein AB